MRRSAIMIACLSASACMAAPSPSPAPSEARRAPELTLAEVERLRRQRDFFALGERLAAERSAETAAALYARALVEHAFNRPAESNASIAALLRRPEAVDSLRFRLWEMEAANHLRLHQYRAGVAAVDSALAMSPVPADSGDVKDMRTIRRLMQAVADVPPQTLRVSGPTTLKLDEGRIPVRVGDSARTYVFDTGANISTLMRSEAAALGLRVRPAGIEVGSATDIKVTADMAAAERVVIGGMEFRDVVFLVMDDAMLTFGDFRIPGIIGFPVIQAMGEVHLRRTGEIHVPAEPPTRPVRNLALDGLTPLTRVGVRGEPLVCRLDTGANATVLYEPFYRRHRAWVDPAGTAGTRRTGGAGGFRDLPMVTLPPLEIAVGDTTLRLARPEVLTRSVADREEQNYLLCNLGHDVLDAFSEYVINFRDMSFLLR